MDKCCEDCGRKFAAGSWNEKRCPRCKEMWTRYQSLKRSRKHFTLQYHVARVSGSENIPRCKYCGRIVKEGVEFCCRCREEGADILYKEFGTTNGWDKPKVARKKVPLKPGWRGQVVIGGNADFGSHDYRPIRI